MLLSKHDIERQSKAAKNRQKQGNCAAHKMQKIPPTPPLGKMSNN